MNIRAIITNLINSLLDGSFERMRIISQMNAAFKEYFTTGEFKRLCKVSISQGNSALSVPATQSSLPCCCIGFASRQAP